MRSIAAFLNFKEVENMEGIVNYLKKRLKEIESSKFSLQDFETNCNQCRDGYTCQNCPIDNKEAHERAKHDYRVFEKRNPIIEFLERTLKKIKPSKNWGLLSYSLLDYRPKQRSKYKTIFHKSKYFVFLL